MGEIITIHAALGKAVLKDIPTELLHSGTYQPRDAFPEESLEQLSQTIAQLGVLEPLIVRGSPKNTGQYEIIAGERRWRAARLAGLTTVPCLLANYSNEQSAQVALIENTCREGLNPIAEASAMQRLATEFRYTHEEIGALLGVSRVHVTNMLRLLKLDARIQHWMKGGSLSEGHGKVLAGLKLERQYWFAYEAIKKEWSVSMLNDAINTQADRKKSRTPTEKPFIATIPLGRQMTERLGHPVKVTLNRNESGSLRVQFHDRQHMQVLLEKLGCADLIETQVVDP